ncbi:MAG: AsmA-like C-terminal domain-containing protein [Desulfurivibrio sp.]
MFYKIRLILLGLLLATAAMALAVSLLLDSESMVESAARQLGERLGSEIDLDSLELVWLPLPHLLVKGIELEHPRARLLLGEAHIYPRWRSLGQLRIEMGQVILEDPHLFIDPADFALPDSPAPLSPTLNLPATGELRIRRGSISFTGPGDLAGIATAPMQLDRINGQLNFNPSRLTLELEAHPSFGASLAVRGWYQRSGAHHLTIDGKALRLHEAILSLAHGQVTMLETLANLELELRGNGLDDFTATLHSQLPCFLLAPEEGRVRLDCGVAHLELTRKNDDWQLLIHDFEIKEPGMRLEGMLSRRLPATDHGLPIPYWEIDIRGRDLDAGEIREAVLAMLGRFRAAREVYKIVLDGHAKSAGFHFSGPESDLTDFRNMIVTVEVETAEIMVPEVDLHLHDASGSLLIENGILELRQARATLGDSQGHNCSLTVGLFKELRQFKLDLELDAALADLRQVLPGLIKHPAFQAEVGRFHQPEGRATGRLSIGDTRDQFNVLATIETLRGRVETERLPWPLEVTSARAQISRDQVSWTELRGNIGPHRIEQAAGWVGIEETIPFILQELVGEVAVGPLFRHLQEYPLLQRALAPVLTEVAGRAELHRGRAAGELRQPEGWDYELLLTPRGLSWHSPLLATKIINEGYGSLLFSSSEVRFQDLTGMLRGDRIILDGALQHRLLRDWSGELRLTGLVTGEGQGWLEERAWLPSYLLPAVPLVLNPLTLQLASVAPKAPGASRETKLTGIAGVLQGGREHAPATLQFSSELPTAAAGKLTLEASLDDELHRANLSLELGPESARGDDPPAIHLNFQGELATDSLARFFHQPPFSGGRLEGRGEFHLPEGARGPSFSGEIKAEGVRWHPGAEALDLPAVNERPTMEIISLALEGSEGIGTRPESEIVLHHLELSLSADEQLRLTGLIRSDAATGLTVDLALDSPFLRRSSLLAWRDRIRNGPPSLEGETVRWPLAGSIGLNLESFDSGPTQELLPDEIASDQASLTWIPLQGRLALYPSGGLSAEITRAVLCCLEITGTWYSDPALGVGNFRIASACPESSRFEDILSCLEIGQDIIQGDCLVDAELRGDTGFWREGRIMISSPGGGRIMRLKLLSRIFSLVNLTDIFTGGITGLDEQGFAYQQLEFEGVIENNVLRLERAVVKGEGLNLFVRGSLDLGTYQANLTVMIATFKTLDAIIGRIPFIGRALGGPDTAIITIPVGVRGDIRNPEIMVLHPEAVGEGMLNLLRNTLLLPFNILSPIIPRGEE